jgi:hypothetical protein
LQKGTEIINVAEFHFCYLLDMDGIYRLTYSFFEVCIPYWRPVLVVEEAGVPEENHRPWTSNW